MSKSQKDDMRTNFQEYMDCIELQSPEISDIFCWLYIYIHIYILRYITIYSLISYIYIHTNIYQQIQQLLVIYSHHPRRPPVASRADLVKEVLPPFFEPGIARATWAKSLWLGFDESNVFLFCFFKMSNVVLFLSYRVFIDLLFVSNRWIYCIMEFFYVFLFSQ